MMSKPMNISIWLVFALGLVLATAPVWQRAVYGFDPTLDELVKIALCRSSDWVEGSEGIAASFTARSSCRKIEPLWARSQTQPSSFTQRPECQILVMWLILSPANCMT